VIPHVSPSGITGAPAISRTVHDPEVNRLGEAAARALDPAFDGVCFVDLKGLKELKGLKGQGPKGLKGQGPKGRKEPTGPTGPSEPTGLNGLNGLNGPNGLDGLDGPTGGEGLEGDAAGRLAITELNAGRFGTTHFFYTAAGANFPEMLLRTAYGEVLEVPQRDVLPAGLVWIRTLDAGPVLATEAAIAAGDWPELDPSAGDRWPLVPQNLAELSVKSAPLWGR
jgi:hypothetical protein